MVMMGTMTGTIMDYPKFPRSGHAGILVHKMEKIESPDDEELLDRILARDTAAFAMLYDRHCKVAYALAYRIVGDSGLAEDVVQEAFLSLWRRVETYGKSRGSVRTWLMAIVHHRAIDRLRGRLHHEGHQEPLEEEAQLPDNVDTWEQARQSIEGQQVREALMQLPPDQQRSVILAYFGGYTHDEIARKLGVPLGTVKGRLRIGLQKMRAHLQTQGPEAAR